jgi:hypothetical protein
MARALRAMANGPAFPPRPCAARALARKYPAMLGRRDDQEIEIECPECGAVVKATAKEAEKGTLRCPNGHTFAVMGMLGGDPDAPQ